MKKNFLSNFLNKFKVKINKNDEADTHDDIENDRNRLLNENTPFAIKEAYRSLYTNIMYLPTNEKSKIIAITSARSGEGKSLVSLNVALSLAENMQEKNILFLESDMRGPRASKIMNLDNKNIHGLSEYLAGIDEEPNFCDSKFDNLKILRSGSATNNSTALFSSPKMKDLKELLNEKFDYVIVDTPPVNVVSDALLISDYVIGYFLVVRSDYSDLYSVSEVVNKIKQFNGKIFGFVMTSYEPKGGGNYYQRYSAYDPYSK